MQLASRQRILSAILAIAIAPVGAAAKKPAIEETKILKESVMVPMREGVQLDTNIFRRADTKGALPVLLLRTPYQQEKYEAQARQVAAGGYIAVTQDSRGRFGSEGEWPHYWDEGPDGFDTVVWIKEQPWCNGKVGMWGHSYNASVQWLAAAEGTPLTAFAPAAGAPHFYYNVYQSGTLILALVRAGFGVGLYGPPREAGQSPNWPKYYLHLPLTEMDKAVGYEAPWQMSMIKHYRPTSFWKRANAYPDIGQMDLPGQYLVGYFDFLCRETVRGFQEMVKRSASEYSRSHQQLVIGPWGHGTGRRKVGDFDFGPEAEMDMVAETLIWYDNILKKAKGESDPFPVVRYFSMGENRWHTATQWPPAEAEHTALYLVSNGSAVAGKGDGRLQRQPPDSSTDPSDTFKSDPADPVPTVPASGTEYRDAFEPTDQREAWKRDDVLVYKTAPLNGPLDFAGPITAEIFASADVVDADWVVKLIDLHPDGTAQPLTTGLLRASARESDLHRKLMEPGQVYKLTIDVGHTAARIRPGHALVVQIAGSNFPIHDRNLHTGEGPEGARILVAHQKVWHTEDQASKILLPVIGRED